ncbi:MAG: LuxR C-terminal-related transcriptional regulator [Rhodobacter sp.]|nr:LuxR C-terminal-related transcriptional regulator [Rhodobacter sp.]
MPGTVEPDDSDSSAIEDLLTPRECEIARLTSQGMTNKEIAQTLEISHWTVATHLRRIYDKTDVHRRAALSSAISAGRLR